ncbi:MAG: hypothetical protein ABIS50_16645 [Luteolibacter sp.]|uniref:hypothetical protein n=1 Tax=Luteolibacter sp. TaxID=1962973 RepID=UPI0032678796
MEKSKAIDSKIGNLVESRIGAKAAWVMKGDTESDVIPAAAGGVLTHDMVIHLIEAQTRRNVQAAAEILSDDPAGELIDKLLGLLRAPLIRQLQEGDGTLLGKLAGLAFQAHSPQEETAREEPSGG